jgi:D-alanyl-D-alanine carboxypeptidase
VQGYAGAGNPFGGNDAMLSNGRFSFNPQFEWAGGGWSSTTSDLARWGKALFEWKAFDSTQAGIYLDGVPARLGQGVRYGLGVIIWPAPSNAPTLGEALGHSGFFPGYQTELRYYPSHKIAAALQVNSSNGRVMPQGLNMSSAIAELTAVAISSMNAGRGG